MVRSRQLLIEMCVAKIHRATVTQAELSYVGSITIDKNLLDASGIRPFQMVNITNVSNGVLWQTYAMAGPPGKGDICLNGPPARHFLPGDLVIILGKAFVDPSEADRVEPVVVFVDDRNKITRIERHGAVTP
jgi:aspartate 1-decarboxylase